MPHRLPVLLASSVLVHWLASSAAEAQSPPATDIYLVALKRPDANLVCAKATPAVERDGYDNQPSFLPNSQAFLYTSIRGDQADIYRYDLRNGKTTQITSTDESEYSPNVIPSSDRFSVVRVEANEKLTQRLWSFDLEGKDPRLLVPELNPIGYHAWIDPEHAVFFVLGDVATLTHYDFDNRTAVEKAQNIGRCLQTMSFRERLRPRYPAVSFVDKSSKEAWWICSLEQRTGESHRIAQTLPGQEDYVWTSSGEILMAKGSELHVWNHGSWTSVADFSEQGLKSISRLALSPDQRHLAMVVAR